MRLLLTLVMVLWATQSQATKMPVTGMVVTTHPLYLIAQAVTKGVETPALLLSPNQTGHDVQLRPQDRQRIKKANFVLWFGASYEAPLAKILNGQPNSIALFDLKAFERLQVRDIRGKAQPNTLDPHIWLDPINAIAIAHAIAAVRSQQFPQYAVQYQQNTQQFTARMIANIRQFKQVAKPAPYWAYHDAYQYVEKSLQLQFKGSLTVDHDLPPTANQLIWLSAERKRTAQKGSICLLAEGHVDQALMNHLQPVHVQPIDEVMLGQHDFVLAWAALAKQIKQCTSKVM